MLWSVRKQSKRIYPETGLRNKWAKRRTLLFLGHPAEHEYGQVTCVKMKGEQTIIPFWGTFTLQDNFFSSSQTPPCKKWYLQHINKFWIENIKFSGTGMFLLVAAVIFDSGSRTVSCRGGLNRETATHCRDRTELDLNSVQPTTGYVTRKERNYSCLWDMLLCL